MSGAIEAVEHQSALELSATCTLDDAVSPTRCAGGYTYKKHGKRHRLQVSQACRPIAFKKKQVPVYPTCQHRSFDAAVVDVRHINHVTGRVAWPDPGHPLADIRRRGFKYPRNMSPAEIRGNDPAAWQQLTFLVDSACPQAFQPIYHRWLSNHHQECLESNLELGGVKYLSEAYLNETNWGRNEARVAPYTCFYNERCVKAWNTGTGPVCGEIIGWQDSHEDDISQPIAWEACRHNSHGDEPDPDVVLPDVLHSAATSVQSLMAAEAYAVPASLRCTTCDALPMNTQGEFRAKLGCLQKQMFDLRNDSELQALDKVTIERCVYQSMRLVAELGGEHTEPADQREIFFAWGIGEDTFPKCGVPPESPFVVSSPGCGFLAKVDNETLACARLAASKHVVTRSWEPFAQRCAQNVRDLLTQGQDCLADGAAQRLDFLRTAIMDKSLAGE